MTRHLATWAIARVVLVAAGCSGPPAPVTNVGNRTMGPTFEVAAFDVSEHEPDVRERCTTTGAAWPDAEGALEDALLAQLNGTVTPRRWSAPDIEQATLAISIYEHPRYPVAIVHLATDGGYVVIDTFPARWFCIDLVREEDVVRLRPRRIKALYCTLEELERPTPPSYCLPSGV